MPVMENPTNNEANHNHTANEAGARGRVPGQLLTVADVIENDYDNIRDFATVKGLVKERIAAAVGTSVTIA
jgi:hypothetical protein